MQFFITLPFTSPTLGGGRLYIAFLYEFRIKSYMLVFYHCIRWYLRKCCAAIKKNGAFLEKKIMFVTALNLIKCLKQIK